MINETMTEKGRNSSVIRELFEFGRQRKAAVGEENVFDFSIGNPSVPCPDQITRSMVELLELSNPVDLHGYTSAAGDMEARKAVADYRIFPRCGSVGRIYDRRSGGLPDHSSEISGLGGRRGHSLYAVFSRI